MSSKQFSQKQKLVILKKAKEIGFKEAADVTGVHFTTIYDWQRKYKGLGEEAFLAHQPSYPGRGIKEITPQQEKAVMDIWKNYPGFGPGQVRNQLRRQGTTISIRTVRSIIQANGYKATTRKQKGEKSQRFEASRPLELVQMDILEFFINKLKVYLILMLDDFSRFILGCRLVTETSIDEVIALVQTAIDRYGKMEEMLTDRGFVFYSWRGINRFERFLQMHGIDHTHARPHHPQTLGKVEACNRRIKNELMKQQRFSNANDAEGAITTWVDHYNYKRAHQGIGGLLVPAERFHGQADQVLSAVSKGIDVSADCCYSVGDVERSMMNLLLSPDGTLTFYILGQPVFFTGGDHDRQAQFRGSSRCDQDPQDS